MARDNPTWLTKDFLKKCLETDEEFSNVIISSFEVSPAVPPGNNFGSKILRVNLKIVKEDESEDKPISLIVKAPLTDGTVSEIIDNMKDCEPIFYNAFLSHSNKLIELSFAPKSFKSPLPSVVVLEDLKLLQYSMTDRVKQLDFEHCLLYMNAAASFHAASLALRKENPKQIDSIGFPKIVDKFVKNSEFNLKMNKYLLNALADRIKNEEYADIVRSCSTKVGDMLINAHKPGGSLDCLTQGDPWITNMMFKYNEDGKVCNIKLLDFQNVSFGPSAHDIVFFIWSSANHDVRKHKFHELYNIYLDALKRNMKCLNCSEIISYEMFMDEVRKMSPMALTGAGWMPFLLQESTPNLEGVMAALCQEGDSLEENPFDTYYTKSFCENHLSKVLDQLETHGVFEYLAKQMKENY